MRRIRGPVDSVNCGDKETGIVATIRNANKPTGAIVISQGVQPKSIGEAGEKFLDHLIQHFQNDRPDVLELELEAEEPE